MTPRREETRGVLIEFQRRQGLSKQLSERALAFFKRRPPQVFAIQREQIEGKQHRLRLRLSTVTQAVESRLGGNTHYATTCGINTGGPGQVESDLPMKTKTYFAFRVDIWDDAGNNIVEHVAGADDLEVAEAIYKAAIARWR